MKTTENAIKILYDFVCSKSDRDNEHPDEMRALGYLEGYIETLQQ